MSFPEHEKMQAVAEESRAIGEFLDWLARHQSLCLGVWLKTISYGDGVERPRAEPRLVPAPHDPESLLAEYFNIDLQAIEREKREMLAEIRRAP